MGIDYGWIMGPFSPLTGFWYGLPYVVRVVIVYLLGLVAIWLMSISGRLVTSAALKILACLVAIVAKYSAVGQLDIFAAVYVSLDSRARGFLHKSPLRGCLYPQDRYVQIDADSFTEAVPRPLSNAFTARVMPLLSYGFLVLSAVLGLLVEGRAQAVVFTEMYSAIWSLTVAEYRLRLLARRIGSEIQPALWSRVSQAIVK